MSEDKDHGPAVGALSASLSTTTAKLPIAKLASEDACTLDIMLQRETFVASGEIRTEAAVNSTVFSIDVNPTELKSGKHCSRIAYLAQLFDMWQGSLTFNVYFTKAVFQQVKLIMAYLPASYDDVNPTAAELMGFHNRVIINPANEDSALFKVPFICEANWANTTEGLGRLVCKVLQPMVVTQAAKTTIPWTLAVRAGKNFRFRYLLPAPVRPTLTTSKIQTAYAEANSAKAANGVGRGVMLGERGNPGFPVQASAPTSSYQNMVFLTIDECNRLLRDDAALSRFARVLWGVGQPVGPRVQFSPPPVALQYPYLATAYSTVMESDLSTVPDTMAPVVFQHFGDKYVLLLQVPDAQSANPYGSVRMAIGFPDGPHLGAATAHGMTSAHGRYYHGFQGSDLKVKPHNGMQGLVVMLAGNVADTRRKQLATDFLIATQTPPPSVTHVMMATTCPTDHLLAFREALLTGNNETILQNYILSPSATRGGAILNTQTEEGLRGIVWSMFKFFGGNPDAPWAWIVKAVDTVVDFAIPLLLVIDGSSPSVSVANADVTTEYVGPWTGEAPKTMPYMLQPPMASWTLAATLQKDRERTLARRPHHRSAEDLRRRIFRRRHSAHVL